jgi:adenine-specific DNA-methyltransferase
MSFANMIQAKTEQYITTVSKAERKAIGQFFTPVPISDYMGNLSKFQGSTVRILDPGAGCGILTASLIDGLAAKGVERFDVDLYENNAAILPLLESNMRFIRESLISSNIVLNFQIYERNFITDNQLAWTGMMPIKRYDIVISNPPYKKIGKDSLESAIMQDIVYGQPNLYFLFMAMGAKLLKRNGEFIYIVPRSFSSGLYLSAFRKWFLSEMRITNLHLFASREAVAGNQDTVLQETIILRGVFEKYRGADCAEFFVASRSIKRGVAALR